MRHDVSELSGKKSASKGVAYQQIDRILKSAEQKINRYLVRAHEDPISLSFILSRKSDWLSYYDPINRTVYINPRNPQLCYPGRSYDMHKALEPRFIMLSLQAIVDHKLGIDRNYKDALEEIAESTFGIGEALFGQNLQIYPHVKSGLSKDQDIIPVAEIPFSKYRLYTADDISYISGHHVNTVKRLYASGILKPTVARAGRPKFSGQQVREALHEVEGFTPVAMLVDKQGYERDMRIDAVSPWNCDVNLTKAAQHAFYLKDVGSIEHPFIWVRSASIKTFKGEYQQVFQK